MDNILLIFLNKLELVDEFNEIIDKFDRHGYKIYLLDNIKEDEYFSFDSLPVLVESYKEEHQKTNKMVILSNSRDLILSWYRCYNSVVDDFIYFIDRDEKNYFDSNDTHYSFYQSLSGFNGISNEAVQDKIFLNLNFTNYNNIISFLIKESNYRLFDSLNNFNFEYSSVDKEVLSKKYIFNNYEYFFEINDAHKIEEIKLNSSIENNIVLNETIVDKLMHHNYIVPYITVLFYKTDDKYFTNLLLYLFQNMKSNCKEDKFKVFSELLEYIRDTSIDFKEKLYISSLLVMINDGSEILTEFIIESLVEDKRFLEYHFSMLYNILFYKTNENLKFSNKVYVGMRNEMIKLGQFFKKQGKIEVRKKEKDDGVFKIAIHCDQLLSTKHAPTSIALNMAKKFKAYYMNCEVKIFVEDNFIVNLNEVIFPYLYSSAASNNSKDIHEEYLEECDVKVYYSNPSDNKIQRTKEIVQEINEFNPSVIYSTSDVSIAREILYPYYPIIYQTNGGTNFSTLCDAYVLYGDLQKKNLLDINNNIKLLDKNQIIINYKPTNFRSQYKKNAEKSDFGVIDNGFVMVTVGNRLSAELGEDYIEMICSFILEKRDVYWIVVGPQKIDYIDTNYSGLKEDGKIIQVNYEDDLLSLYRACDVYINPMRDGGAGSVSIAMQAGIPVIVDKDSQDSVFVMGEENCIENSKAAYIDELTKLYEDITYRNLKGESMLNRALGRKQWDDYILDYMEIFSFAKRQFHKRKK